VIHAGINVVVDHCTEHVGTVGDRAELWLADPAGEPDLGFIMTIRMLGPPTGDLKFCSQKFSLHEDLETHCVLDTIKGHQGKPSFTIPKAVFDDKTENQVWSVDGADKFRNAQIDIWQAAP